MRPATGGAVRRRPIALTPGYCTLSMLFSDWRRSGERDLRLTNDRHYYREGSDQLWRIVPGEAPRPYTEADGWRPLQIWGMGIASQDVTGDGRPEVFLTSQGDNKLQTLADGSAIADVRGHRPARGVTAHRPYTGGDVLPSTAWHAEFADVNNDSFTDLFIAKGNVEAQEGYADARSRATSCSASPTARSSRAARRPGSSATHKARGAAVVDLNLDGLLDLVVVNRAEPVTLWRNTGSAIRSTGLALSGCASRRPTSTPSGRGWRRGSATAPTSGRSRWAVAMPAGSSAGSHVGLGDADEVEVRVQWPDGETGPWMTLEAGTFAIIERGADEPTPWQPKDG